MKQHIGIITASFLLFGFVQIAQADAFGTGGNQFSMTFEDIDNAGNAPSTNTGYGAVGYNYRVATYEVTIDQFTKAHAVDDRIGSGNENYWNTGGRTIGANAPAVQVSWFEAAKFCNWLTSSNALQGAYLFSDADTFTGVDRNAAIGTYGTVYVLPTEDEWYKAAYHTGSDYSLYANGTAGAPGTSDARYNDTEPWARGSGTQEQNATYDMMGNVWEWAESAWDGTLDDMAENRTIRGGAYNTAESYLAATSRLWEDPSVADANVGFRVASVPEPAVVSLLASSGLMLLGIRRFFRSEEESKEFTLSSATDPF